MKKNQNGFSEILVILIIVSIVSLGISIIKTNTGKTENESENSLDQTAKETDSPTQDSSSKNKSYLVNLKVKNYQPEGYLSEQEVINQRQETNRVKDKFIKDLNSMHYQIFIDPTEFMSPIIMLRMDESLLQKILDHPLVEGVTENVAIPPTN